MEYLNKEEYIQNIRKIFRNIYAKQGNESSNFDNKIQPIDDLYSQYLKLQNINEKAVQQKVVDLTIDPFKFLYQEKNGFSADFWIVLYDLNIYLIKRCIPERIMAKGNLERALENSMVIPEIIKKVGLESAEYYITMYWEEDYGEKEPFIMTPSFLNDNEEMISLNNICDTQNINEIPKLEKMIRQYFEIRKFNKEQIDNLIKDFIKENFMSKFLGNVDENSGNLSIIYDNKRNLRMAPLYDFDFCCGNELQHKCERRVEGSTDIEDFIKYYIKESWFESWLNDIVLNLDLEEILTTQKYVNKISYSTKFYQSFFKEQLKRVRNAIYQSPEIEKDEI